MKLVEIDELLDVCAETNKFFCRREGEGNEPFISRGDNQNDNESLVVRIKYRF